MINQSEVLSFILDAPSDFNLIHYPLPLRFSIIRKSVKESRKNKGNYNKMGKPCVNQ